MWCGSLGRAGGQLRRPYGGGAQRRPLQDGGGNGDDDDGTSQVLIRKLWRESLHAGQSRTESLGPLLPGTMLPLSQRVEADG